MATARNEDSYLGSAYPLALIRERMRRHPRPFLDFALGRFVEPAPEWLPGFVKEHSTLALSRSSADELGEFVEAAVRTLEDTYGVRVSNAQVLPAPSGRAAMSALAAVLIAPGDGVLVTEPGYPAFARVAAQRHARILVLPLDPERAFAPDRAALDRIAAAGTIQMAAWNYPNNPTGSVASRAELDSLYESLGSNIVMFNDAVYGPLTYERPPFSLLSDEFVRDDGASALELHSLGKLFALGPLGMSYLVGTEDLVEKIRQYSDFAWTQLSSLQVRTATRCLEDWQHVERVRDGYRQRLERLRAVVTELGFEAFPTEAGMYLLCRLPRDVGGRPVTDAREAAELLLAEHDIAVVPWDVPPHGYLRFSAAYTPEELVTLAERGETSKLVTGAS